MSNYQALLEEIGLTKAEIKVYLALLELGSTTTGPLIEKSQASSSKIYEILEKLMQKGLASFVVRSNTKYFEAAPPKRIKDYLQEKQARLQQQQKKLEILLPELELKQTLSEYKNEATIYKGMKGLETAFYDSLSMLSPKDEVLTMATTKRSKTISNFFVKFEKERAKRRIKRRIIFNEEARGLHQTLQENLPLGEIKFIPQTTPAAVNIFKHRVIIFPQSDEPLCIVIDSKEVAQSFRAQFDTLWHQETRIVKGFESVKQLFEEMLEVAIAILSVLAVILWTTIESGLKIPGNLKPFKEDSN